MYKFFKKKEATLDKPPASKIIADDRAMLSLMRDQTSGDLYIRLYDKDNPALDLSISAETLWRVVGITENFINAKDPIANHNGSNYLQ